MCFRKQSGAESSGPNARRASFPPESSRASKRPTTPRSPTIIANTEQPKDDASIMRLFNLIDNSITDHVLNYYISPNSSGSDKFSQLGSKAKKEHGWVLRAAASNPSLRESRTQVIVIRAIIGAEIFKAIRDGDFIPPAPKKPETKKHGTKTPVDHKWRLEYYQSLPNNHLYFPHREKAIDRLANEIMKMTQPLVVEKDKDDARLKSLKSIVGNAADFSVTIGKQKPSFRIIFPTPRSSTSASRSSRAGSRRGRAENLDVPAVVPELRKYGDERGTNYDKYLTLVAAQMLPEGF